LNKPKSPWQTKEWKKRREQILLTRNKCEWCGKTKKLQIAHKIKFTSLYYDEYIACRDDEIRVLCASCHLAEHKGIEPCPSCSGWKQKHNTICKKCREREEDEEWEKTHEVQLQPDSDEDEAKMHLYQILEKNMIGAVCGGFGVNIPLSAEMSWGKLIPFSSTHI